MRRFHNGNYAVWPVIFIALFLAGPGTGCAGSRVIRGNITGGNGEPIASAVVYIEAYREGKGPFDFALVQVDSTGTGEFSLSLKWKRTAKIAYAVVAPGMKTICGFDRTRYYETHDLHFELNAAVSGKDFCAPQLTGMGFPFEKTPKLAQRLLREHSATLLPDFLAVYRPIVNGTCPVPSGNEEKIGAIRNLIGQVTADQ